MRLIIIMGIITKDLYLISLFEILLCLGGYALPKAVIINVIYGKIQKKNLFQFLKINKFCFVGK